MSRILLRASAPLQRGCSISFARVLEHMVSSLAAASAMASSADNGAGALKGEPGVGGVVGVVGIPGETGTERDVRLRKSMMDVVWKRSGRRVDGRRARVL